jgi:hypothetical protein
LNLNLNTENDAFTQLLLHTRGRLLKQLTANNRICVRSAIFTALTTLISLTRHHENVIQQYIFVLEHEVKTSKPGEPEAATSAIKIIVLMFIRELLCLCSPIQLISLLSLIRLTLLDIQTRWCWMPLTS